ncbi:O-methyltransferase [Pseudothauera rhizosphaerae]|uniref:DUF1442 domain-containing protein n=1 Tax=Pseudothauera rhizosphaerae TaxID=2565932 RepID=A0A4V3WBC7_9RHOO|nr:DUF1442 domain-containing protein [Pseudothauera rhizosphaerae]THF62727.1 DUF1442 domain-containing protein [Pseudothauera rhizosphaerae]
MDNAIQAVLDVYHGRILDERTRLRENPAIRDSKGKDQLMRAVGLDTGRLLNLLVKSLEAPTILELGTSFGYSAIWLAEAARATGGRVITIELYDYKAAHAREMAAKAGLDAYIDFRVGDALELLAHVPQGLDFVLVDHWKDLYEPSLEILYPKLNPGAIVVADNMVRPANEEVRRYGRAVRAKPGITSVLLPVGSGLEISRYDPVPAYAEA